ncbi:MAG: SIMPL domain-containing protein [Phycisphaeraceae bacterium]
MPPNLEVYGEAEVVLEPDHIEWIIDIRTRDRLPKIARQVNDTLFDAVLKIADKADIDDRDIATGEPGYEQLFDEHADGRPAISDYIGTEVYRRVTLVMRDMDEFESMVDAVHPLGVFYAARRKSTRYDEAVGRVESLALEAARRRAVAQANALGQTLGKAIDVEVSHYNGGDEGGLFGPPPKPIEDDDTAAGPGGRVRVAAVAYVTFSLE